MGFSIAWSDLRAKCSGTPYPWDMRIGLSVHILKALCISGCGTYGAYCLFLCLSGLSLCVCVCVLIVFQDILGFFLCMSMNMRLRVYTFMTLGLPSLRGERLLFVHTVGSLDTIYTCNRVESLHSEL